METGGHGRVAFHRHINANSRPFETDPRPFETDPRVFEAPGWPFEADSQPFGTDPRFFETDSLVFESDSWPFETDPRSFEAAFWFCPMPPCFHTPLNGSLKGGQLLRAPISCLCNIQYWVLFLTSGSCASLSLPSPSSSPSLSS